VLSVHKKKFSKFNLKKKKKTDNLIAKWTKYILRKMMSDATWEDTQHDLPGRLKL
jgi:hypothetical protein